MQKCTPVGKKLTFFKLTWKVLRVPPGLEGFGEEGRGKLMSSSDTGILKSYAPVSPFHTLFDSTNVVVEGFQNP